MPYIGKSPIGGGFHKLDNLTASATATYALTLGSAAYYPETANQLLVSLNGVIQAPQDSFTVSGSNLVFDSALTSSDSIDFVVALGDVLGVGSVSDGAITTAKIGNGAVTAAKLAAGVQGVAGITSSSTSGTALSIDANNIVTTPVRPAFFAHSPTDASRSSDAVLVFASETFDRTNNYNNTTGEFTCPVDGIYLFSWHCLHLDNGAYGITKLQLNGSAYANAQTYSGIANGGSSTASATLYCQANDVVRVFNMGATYSSVTNDNYAFFSGHLVG